MLCFKKFYERAICKKKCEQPVIADGQKEKHLQFYNHEELNSINNHMSLEVNATLQHGIQVGDTNYRLVRP